MPCTEYSEGILTDLDGSRWLTLLDCSDYYPLKSIFFSLRKTPVLLLSLCLGKTTAFSTEECCVTNIVIHSSSSSLVMVTVIVAVGKSVNCLLNTLVSSCCLSKFFTSTPTTF